jgi:rSAM/selenodomain-associated transferase 1
MEQSSGDLGDRMRDCLNSVLKAGAMRVVLIGSDSPDLPPSFIEAAFDSLNECDLVFGPTVDGGYYLIGASRALPPSFFEGVSWSSADTLAATLIRARDFGFSAALLEMWHDIDEYDDLTAFRERGNRDAAPETFRWLREWEQQANEQHTPISR